MNKTIAIIYAAKSIATALGKACESSGGVVTLIEANPSVIHEVKGGSFGMILIDYSVLRGDSKDLLAQIRDQSDLSNVFVSIYMPANEDLSEVTLFPRPDHVLQSPFTAAKVNAAMRQAFSFPNEVMYVGVRDNTELLLALREMGYEVSFFDAPELALNAGVEKVPDFIIAEYKLSEQTALDLRKSQLACSQLKDVPMVVAYQGRDVNEIESIIRCDVEEVLLSPFASAVNLKKIQDHFPLPPRGKRLKALVVDDSPSVSKMIASMFRKLGYEVELAVNGFDGYKKMAQFKPDIVTSDYDMPVLDGWGFCLELRDDANFRDIPIIMITSRDSPLDRKKGELLGVSSYLTKPFVLSQLKHAIKDAVASAKVAKEQEAIAKFVASDTLKAVTDMVDGGKRANIGSEKYITVLFTDIVAFSEKCERYSPRKIIKLLNTYFDLMVGVLSEHGAIIDKFIGDAIVARFDSGNIETDAINAVKAAWRMQEKLKEFNEESFEEIQIRIGVNSGDVILGNLGSKSHRLEYAMIGDSVNIGQRLESSAPAKGCMISESTYEHAKKHVLVSERKEIEVKGKSNKVPAYIVTGLA